MNIQNQLFKPDGKNSIHDGIEHSPSGGKALIDPTDTVLLLLDHQTGLFQNVKDIAVADLRRNTTALAKLGGADRPSLDYHRFHSRRAEWSINA